MNENVTPSKSQQHTVLVQCSSPFLEKKTPDLIDVRSTEEVCLILLCVLSVCLTVRVEK